MALKARTQDKYNLEERLETLIHEHLLDLEENPNMYASKDRLATIQYVGMFLNRKFGWGETESAGVGSSVRKYAAAFKTNTSTAQANAAGGRAKSARSSLVAVRGVTSDDADSYGEDTAA